MGDRSYVDVTKHACIIRGIHKLSVSLQAIANSYGFQLFLESSGHGKYIPVL